MSDLAGESAILQALQIASESAMSEINTVMPGVIVSVSGDGSRVVVKPTMPKALASGVALDAPQIIEVPVIWPRSQGGQVGLTLPLRPGDGVMLAFAQRSLEGWLSGQETAPDDPRRFDLSDAIAIPGLMARGATANADEAQFFFGPVKLRLLPNGSGILETGGGNITIHPDGKVTIPGDVEVLGDVKAGTISLKNHRHLGVQPGGGVTGVPQP